MILGFTVISFFSNVIAMDTPETQTRLIVVPGQNGVGGIEATNTHFVLPRLAHDRSFVGTPLSTPDFGQSRCQEYLNKTMSELPKTGKNVIHASSQGTATSLNYAAHNPDKVHALILEGVMLSGNSAIAHTTANQISPSIDSAPIVRDYSLPYSAKSFMFPFYAPAGEQPIFNVEKLPKNLPIILIHATQDPQLAFKDTVALYAFLRTTQKNNNVYLIPREMYGHVLLLDENNIKEINAINAILEKHGLLPQSLAPDSVDLSFYQPEPTQEALADFNIRKTKETRLWYFDKFLKFSLLGVALTYILHKIGVLETVLEKIPFNK